MGTVISNLKARFGVDTSDFKKGLKDGEKAVDDFKGSAGNVLDEFASMFGVNMMAVNNSVKTAQKSLAFLRTSFVAASTGGKALAISMQVLKVALISTGIGAIVVVLGSLIAYFTKSGQGADKFARILSQLKSVVNNIVDRFAILGKGLFEIFSGKFKEGWETMKSSFRGIGEEITTDWKEAGKLADAEDALEDKEIALINSLEERRAKIADLRREAKEETEDMHKKYLLMQEAEKLTKSVYGDQISLEKERLRIMKEKLAIQTSDPTDEQRREVAEQEAKINALYREQNEQLKALLREKKEAAKYEAEQLAFQKTKAAQAKIERAEINNLKMPDFSQVINSVKTATAQVKSVTEKASFDLAATFNDSLGEMGVGIGEFFGKLASGDAGIEDFGNVVGETFANMAITVGKIAIGAGIATLGIKKALESLNGYAAIAAGMALVALGTAVKGSLSSVASGGSSTSSSSLSSSGSSSTYDNTHATKTTINITGKLVAEGNDLVYVFEKESNRRKIIRG